VTDGLAVRRARLDDLKVIVELRLALLREYGDHPLYANLRSDADERAVDLFRAQLIAPNECIFLAERHGSVVGVLRCVESPITPLLFPDRYGYVSSVYVRPADRRQGALHALVAAAEAWCEERGITEMRLHSATSSAEAVGAWDALGFEIVEHVRRRTLASAHSQSARHSHIEVR
jgi:ribosomal protein S18 acetylase RimI-like enzyme